VIHHENVLQQEAAQWGAGVGENITALLRNFQSPYASLEAYFSDFGSSHHGMRYGVDFLLAVASLLPERILGLSLPPTVATVNTLLVQGDLKSIVPPGFLTFSLYTLSLPGLIFLTLAFGFVMGGIHSALRSVWTVWWVKALYAVVALRWARFFFSGEPKVTLFVNIDVILALALLIYFNYLVLHRRPPGERERPRSPWWR
jgi:hypothetical protein